jgi:DNA-binding GntR family transcriptional regulator
MKKQEVAYENEEHEEFMVSDMKIHKIIAIGSRNRHLEKAISVNYANQADGNFGKG